MAMIPRGEILDSLTLYREEITPEIAAQMLKLKNPGNRKISKNTVYAYANDMSRGDWDANAVSPIVFDSSGMLVDGHHRLNAIIVSKTPVITYVAENADQSFTYNLDLVRSINNILQMNGVTEVSNNATAVIRLIGELCFGSRKTSIGEIRKAYITDGATISEICRIARRGKKAIVGGASFTAAMYVAHKCGISLETLEEFAQVTNTGIQSNANQSSAVVLRNQIIEKNLINIRYERQLFFLCTQEAIKDFSEGKNRKNAYTGKTAIYSKIFAEEFRAGNLFGYVSE